MGDGRYKVGGTSDANYAMYNLFAEKNAFPDGIVPGQSYYVDYEDTSGSKKLEFFVAYYVDGAEVTAARLTAPGVFTVPVDATGIILRLTVMYAENTIPECIVEPRIYAADVIPSAKLRNPKKPAPMLTIIDDDGCRRFYEYLLPLCREKNVPMTSPVVITQIEARESGETTYWMNWEQILECYASGIEIVSHTYDHASSETEASRTKEEVATNYRKAHAILEMHGIHTDCICYNGGTASTYQAQYAARNSFRYAFIAGGDRINYAGSIDPYNIARYKMDVKDGGTTAFAALDELIEAQTGWMVWMIHTSDSSWQDNAEAYTAIYGQLIDYALENGIQIVTTDYGYRTYVEPYL